MSKKSDYLDKEIMERDTPTKTPHSPPPDQSERSERDDIIGERVQNEKFPTDQMPSDKDKGGDK